MSDNAPKGGRGLTAPYQTCVMRVPRPCEKRIWEIVNEYRDTLIVPQAGPKIDKDQLIKESRKILDSKIGRTKSAKLSLEKLLQVIFKEEIIL